MVLSSKSSIKRIPAERQFLGGRSRIPAYGVQMYIWGIRFADFYLIFHNYLNGNEIIWPQSRVCVCVCGGGGGTGSASDFVHRTIVGNPDFGGKCGPLFGSFVTSAGYFNILIIIFRACFHIGTNS